MPCFAQRPAAEFERTASFIRYQLNDKQIASIAIAVVNDQRVLWSEGFGFADPKALLPATAGTVYRVGSVSKLFTDIAVMQMVERGQLDLDAPVAKVLPGFAYPKVTLRQLMCHRGGLVREPRIGSYFDASGRSLAETVESLRGVPLVYAPGTVTKYSNAGIAVVGRVVEVTAGKPFAEHLQRAVLDPLGMMRSSFERTPAVKDALAKAYLWAYDRATWEAPVFDLGIAPAGNLYASVDEMARFLMALLKSGAPVLRPGTLEQMWTPQGPGVEYGLGFALSQLDGRRTVGHDGAVYGFAASVLLLPEEKLGVVVTASKDSANAVTRQIARETLRDVLADRLRQARPARLLSTAGVPGLQGRYQTEGGEAIELSYRDHELYLLPVPHGQRYRLRSIGADVIVDDTLGYSDRLSPVNGGGLSYQGKTWKRAAEAQPVPVRQEWRPLVGEYGTDDNVLYVLEREGRLSVLIEWFDYYALEELPGGRFRFPAESLYAREDVVFTSAGVTVGGLLFARRAVGTQEAVFRIKPVRPLTALRAEAEKLSPPREAGLFRAQSLTDLTRLDSSIRLDIRYASTENFLSSPSYTSARAFLQKPAAEAVVRVHRRLREQGYGLLIHDAYRPWYITKVFWDATPAAQHEFVADPAKGSRHNRGCAVDLSMYHLATRQPVEMVGVYDEMSPRSYPDYPGGTSLQRWHRELLRREMEAEGFTVEPSEWWHFNYRDWPFYRIGNERFEGI